jgi:aminotransferase
MAPYRRARQDPGMPPARPSRSAVPAPVARLPEQYFMGIVAAAARAAALPGPRVIDLGRGNPDLPPPPHAIAALQQAAGEVGSPAIHGYPPFPGLAALREAVAARYLADHGVVLDPEREIAVVPGTKTGIMLCMLAAAGEGDGVLLPDPGYPDYLSAVGLTGARHLPLGLDPSAGWQPDLAAADPGAALTVLNFPSNPCAVCAAPGTFAAAVAHAHRTGGWLLNDLAYGFLTFDGRRGRSVLEEDGAREVAVELWSASKIYGMAGWRIGFLAGAAELVGRVRTLVEHTTAGVFTAVQRGAIAALTGDQGHVARRRAVYAARRDRLVGILRSAGVDVQAPEGSFYLWWKLPPGLDAGMLLDVHRVAVAPGEGFGSRGAGHARLSLAVGDDDLDEGAHRLAAAAAQAAGRAA